MPFISASAISPYNSIRGGAEGGLVPTGLLLDLYPNAAAAYSLRKLRTSYSGPAIEARKTVGGETFVQDIGFVGNELDTASLLTFANGGDVFVAKWYDQSGTASLRSFAEVEAFVANGNNDAFQVSQSAQASIVLSGVLNTTNGNVAALGESSTVYRTGNSIFNGADGTYSGFVVSKLTSNFDGIMQLNNLSSGGGGEIFRYFNTSSTTFRVQSWDSGGNAPVLVTEPINANSNAISSFIRRLDSLTTSSNSLTNSLLGLGEPRKNIEDRLVLMGSGVAGFGLESYFSEAILYPSDQTANRAGIEQNINSFYNIYWDGSQTGLLDDYPSAVAAYSLRALNSAYTGPAIEARRSSDDAVKDIGFLYDGSLDTESLLSFAGSDDVSVAKWYDQSGAGNNDATQISASKQPILVSNGAVNELNGKPTMSFSSPFLMYLNLTEYPFTSGGSATEKSIFAVALNDSTVDQNLYNIADGRDLYALTYNRVENNTYGFLGANYGVIGGNITGQNIISSFAISPSSETFNNAVEGVSSNPVRGIFNSISIGSRGEGSYPMNGNIQEIVMYESNQSANRAGIESNINSNYNIYWDGSQTGLLDDYPNAAAAYSLRALNSAYTGPAIKVRRSSDNEEQDIGLLYDGSLNTASLLAFVGSGDGFVTTWYDQSGGSNATQGSASKQPKIVNSGAVITENGEPSVEFNGTTDYIQNQLSVGPTVTSFAVSKIADEFDNYFIYDSFGTNGRIRLGLVANQGYFADNGDGSYVYATTASNGSQNLFFTKHTNSEVSISVDQDTLQTVSNTNFSQSTEYWNIGARNNGSDHFLEGTIQELILYPSDQTSNRAGIETNINNHYTIY